MKKENMNNKGFSLVELIIVIAIMAILIVVLAPQYLVHKSYSSTMLFCPILIAVRIVPTCSPMISILAGGVARIT